MWQRYDPNWDETKLQLLRNFFEDPRSNLTTIEEEDESFDSRETVSRSPSREASRSPSRKASRSPSREASRSPSREASRSPSREASRSPSREASRSPSREASRSPSREASRSPSPEASPPYSPLPSLIIEKEPNKHDEPDEYYEKLEIIFRRAYRKLFIEGKSDLSTDDEEEEDIVDAAIEIDADSTIDNNVDEEDFSNKSTSIDEISRRDDNSSGNEVSVENNKESSKADDIGSNKSNENIEVNLPDEIHYQNPDENNKQMRKRSIENQDNDSSVSKKSKSNTLTDFIEDVSNTEHSEDEVIVLPNDFRDHRVVRVEAMIHTSARDEMLLPAVADGFDDNDDVSLILEENRVPDNLNSSGRKRSWPSSEGSVRVAGVGMGTQTDDHDGVHHILRDIFVGPPKVFRLC